MPKKRHQNKYSKPPSVAPPILSSSSSSRTTEQQHERSVNQLLADLRRSSIKQNGAQNNNNNFSVEAPTVPPSIRQILQIPETPAPAPRRPQRRDANGRRAPPGPPPPRSWVSLAQSRHAPAEFGKADGTGRIQHWPLPGAYSADPGSLVDLLLRRMALDWGEQRLWNQFYLYTMPTHLRLALLSYISEFYEPGLSIKDLRLVLTGPGEEELAEYEVEKPDLAKLNVDAWYLDLAGSVGKSVTLKELNELLCLPKVTADVDPQDSWDTSEPVSGPVKLLPNLTQLSLAIDPGTTSTVSWKQLLSLASKLPTLTHLNLSGWPEPSLTPNAKFAKVASPLTGKSVQYGGTGPYSHNLDGDWSEAILVLKRLSKALYGLEYLDLTGCGDWIPALMKKSDGDFTVDFVDWVGDWGKIKMLRLCSGYALPDDSTRGQILRFAEWVDIATAIEKHIRAQRSGRGRFITVEKDTLPETAKAVVEAQQLRSVGVV
ncbi:tafazzin [Hypoxylon fuscum]|nr:tafazzin [Hypoxylon fuscum]